MDIEARMDDTHRALLGMLPPDLMDFTDLDTAVDQLMTMLQAAPVELPESVELVDHHVQAADGHQIMVRLYRPRDARPNGPGLFWIHGGGLILGDVSMDDAHCAGIAAELNIVVASVDYRLAPEFAYPTPLDDCVVAFEWLVEQSGQLGLDRERLAVGGGSAGGGLAAALTLRLRDGNAPQPCFQLLRYPMLDDRNETPSSHAITDLRVWNRSANLIGWSAYLGDRRGMPDVDAYAAPARAADLSALPPAIVTVGDLDMFLDEDIAYAQALLGAGVPTELHVYPGSFHGSDTMLPDADASRRWRRDEIAALGRAFDITPE
jgi:acetyl esterase/lipase